MSKSTLIAGYQTSQGVMMANLEGISHEDSIKLPEDQGNPLNWIAGHLLSSRGGILKLVGGQSFLSEEESEPYKRGSKLLEPSDNCVRMERLVEGLVNTGDELIARLKDIPESELEKEFEVPGFPVKFDEPTVASHLILLMFHEGYHTGQLGLGRRVLGKESAIK